MSTEKCQKKWLEEIQLERSLKDDLTPFLGTIPAPFLAETGLGKFQAFEFLDKLSQKAYSKIKQAYQGMAFPFTQPFDNSHVIIEDVVNKKPVRLTLTGQGCNGWVYRLQVGSHCYAFKVYGRMMERSPVFDEAATGIYMTALKTKNLPLFYAANPSQSWLMMEYIEKDTNVWLRPGKTYQEHGFSFCDEDASNCVSGVRTDFGGMYRETKYSSLRAGFISLKRWVADKYNYLTQ